MKINCLRVTVYRNPYGDCSNNGISNRFQELLVYCPNGPHHFFSEHELPLNFCMVDSFRSGVDWPGYSYIIPAMVNESGQVVRRPGWFMAGGNIVDTSDRRWHELTGTPYPLKIHDRTEW